jgi:hypothetical protein
LAPATIANAPQPSQVDKIHNRNQSPQLEHERHRNRPQLLGGAQRFQHVDTPSLDQLMPATLKVSTRSTLSTLSRALSFFTNPCIYASPFKALNVLNVLNGQ